MLLYQLVVCYLWVLSGQPNRKYSYDHELIIGVTSCIHMRVYDKKNYNITAYTYELYGRVYVIL